MNLFGCCILPEHYNTIQRLGYDYIEFPGVYIAKLSEPDFEALVAKVSAGALDCYGMVSLLPPDIKVMGPQYDAEQARRFADFICARAHKLGATVLGVGSPKSRELPPDFDLALAWRQTEEFMKIFSDAASLYEGMSILYEPINSKMCQFGNSLREGADFVRKIDRENVALVCDLGHMELEGEGVDDLTYAAPFIRHIHLAEGLGRTCITREYYDYYHAVLGKLLSTGYEGNFSIEPFPFDDLETHAAQSLEILHEIIPRSQRL